MNFFSYDSKPMQILGFLGDLIFLNIAYLLCCIPIFTIGAAQAGLYTAIKVLTDPEDDSSAMAAFFRGFANGFGTITLTWGIVTLVLCVMTFCGYIAIANGAPLLIVAVALSLLALYQGLIPVFHFRFGCTPMQLLRNTFFLPLGFPIQCFIAGALIWAPVIVFLLVDITLFQQMFPIFGTLYYSTAVLFSYTFLKKPFKMLIEQFNTTHPQEQPEEATKESNAIFRDVVETEEA